MPDEDKLQVVTYSVSIGGVDVGYCDDPDVAVEKELKDITVQQLHKQVLGQRLLGVKPTVKMRLLEITPANLALAFPWFDGVLGTDSIPIAPPVMGEDMYQYAVEIILHPMNKAADDKTEDYTLLKCVCTGPHNRSSDGEKEDGIDLEFLCLPDRASLPNIVLGYIGSKPVA